MISKNVIISDLEFKTAYIMEKVNDRVLEKMKSKAKYNKRVSNRDKLNNKRGNKKWKIFGRVIL